MIGAGADGRLTYNVEEAGRLLGLSKNLAYAAIASGAIPSIRIGRRILVPRAALNRLLELVGANSTNTEP